MDIRSSSAASQATPIGQPSRMAPAPSLPAQIKISPAGTAQSVAAPRADQSAQLEEAVKAINDMLAPATNAIAFSIDSDSGKTVVKLVDNQTNEVIRQFPSKEMLAIAKDMIQLKGLLISEKS